MPVPSPLVVASEAWPRVCCTSCTAAPRSRACVACAWRSQWGEMRSAWARPARLAHYPAYGLAGHGPVCAGAEHRSRGIWRVWAQGCQQRRSGRHQSHMPGLPALTVDGCGQVVGRGLGIPPAQGAGLADSGSGVVEEVHKGSVTARPVAATRFRASRSDRMRSARRSDTAGILMAAPTLKGRQPVRWPKANRLRTAARRAWIEAGARLRAKWACQPLRSATVIRVRGVPPAQVRKSAMAQA